MSKQSHIAPSPIEVQKYLRGLDYPAQKLQIIDKAEEEGADAEILDLLLQLPDREFDSAIEVSTAIAKIS